jgi:glutathione S-transferase
MIGEGRDLRAQWALEETGLPYRVHALDYIASELDGPAYSRLSYFHQVPVIDDDGFIVGESGAVLLYIAEKAGKLIPADFAGRTQVVQWCFAALATVERPLFEIQMIDGGMGGEGARERRAWSSRPAAGSTDWSAGWMAASGSRALSSRSPTFSSPPSCEKSARPISLSRIRD